MVRFTLTLLLVCLLGLSARADETASRPVATAFTLNDLDGKQVRLGEYRGKVVVVSFWATWCAPCKQELKFLASYHEKLKSKGLVVLAVATDGPETQAQVRRIARRQRWTMPVLTDIDSSVAAALNPRGSIPCSLFVDRGGRIAHVHHGFTSGDQKSYLETIGKLLAEAGS